MWFSFAIISIHLENLEDKSADLKSGIDALSVLCGVSTESLRTYVPLRVRIYLSLSLKLPDLCLLSSDIVSVNQINFLIQNTIVFQAIMEHLGMEPMLMELCTINSIQYTVYTVYFTATVIE